MTRRIRTLLLSPVPLDKPVDGTKLRGLGLSRSLERHGPVDHLFFSAEGRTDGGVPLPSRPSSWERLFSLTPPLVRCFSSDTFAEEVRRRAPDYDLCLCLGLQMLQYSSALPPAMPVIADVFNVESDILLRLARQRSGFKRCYWLWQALKLYVYEKREMARATRVVAISRQDGDKFARYMPSTRIAVVPPGLDLEPYLAATAEPAGGVIAFVGTLDWHVNIEAVHWMAQSVLPIIRQTRPATQFTIVGRNPGPEVVALAGLPGVSVEANVPEVVSYLRRADVVVAPILYGSGVQNKVIEALATGRPVVTTSIGFEGLELLPGRDLLVADDASEFAKHCIMLLGDGDAAERMAGNGRQEVAELYTMGRMHSRIDALLEQLFSPALRCVQETVA
jgi:polysaccharide biosynthesis protein PslH